MERESDVSYVDVNLNCALWLDRMESYIYPDFMDSVESVDTSVIQISGDFTSACQSRDVGVIQSFKTR